MRSLCFEFLGSSVFYEEVSLLLAGFFYFVLYIDATGLIGTTKWLQTLKGLSCGEANVIVTPLI